MKIDWSKCAAIQTIPGKVSGQPVIEHSRVRPEDLIENEAEGAAWLARNHGIPEPIVNEVLTFYHRHKRASAPHLH
jgi:uncharacterized protein (DUF433 family)